MAGPDFEIRHIDTDGNLGAICEQIQPEVWCEYNEQSVTYAYKVK